LNFETGHIQLALAVAGIALSIVTAVLALWRDFRSPVYLAYAFGMTVLAAETVLSLLTGGAVWRDDAIGWAKWRLAAGALVPGSWLLFSLSYSRRNYKQFVKRWKWIILAAFAVPLLLVCFAGGHLFIGSRYIFTQQVWLFALGSSGYAFHVFLLLFSVLILVNLEKTLRTSYGAIRWQIKFSILGIGLIFAARVYTEAQTLLYSIVDTRLFAINSSVLVIANILVIVSALRNRLREASIYVSQDFLYNSLTLLASGFYLLMLGITVKLAIYLGLSETLFQSAFFVLLALLGAAALLLSEHVRYKLRWYIHRNFRRPFYDYRKIWTDFTHKTGSLTDTRLLCAAVVKTVSETFLASAVSIWLVEEAQRRPVLTASTALSAGQGGSESADNEAAVLVERMRGQQEPVDLESPGWELFSEPLSSFLEGAEIRYCVPLAAGGEFIGVLTLNNRTGPPFSIEDFDLLKTFADQAAALILNQKLFESLGRAREMEAFQAVSAFFAHDLKNVASTLSLTLANLPVHYENPEFRADALKMMSKSVEKIQNMCSRLSVLDQKFELRRCECDLNELVSNTISNLNLGCVLLTDLGPLPKAFLDPEQIQKVILNLLLNANESAADGTEIRIATCRKGDYLLLSVTDQGCGMPRKFIDQSLFHPFKTTKERGSGIGLYQSKMIVEAHRGRIEVQSREGRGSTFSMLLPLTGSNSRP
jgi:putative PEP-CTERM system histidine kinase